MDSGATKGNGNVDWEEKINLAAAAQPPVPASTLYKPYESNNNNTSAAAFTGVTPELFTYYQLLKSFYDAGIPVGQEAVSERAKNFHISNLIQAAPSPDIVDLTNKQQQQQHPLTQHQPPPSAININIEGDSNRCHQKNDTSTANNSLMSVDVSINLSKSSSDDTINELKISCKTTPTKKRYTSGAYEKVVDECDGGAGRKSKDGQQQQQTAELPITSTYLQMTRSMGLADDDALNLVSCAVFSICYLPSKFYVRDYSQNS